MIDKWKMWYQPWCDNWDDFFEQISFHIWQRCIREVEGPCESADACLTLIWTIYKIEWTIFSRDDGCEMDLRIGKGCAIQSTSENLTFGFQ